MTEKNNPNQTPSREIPKQGMPDTAIQEVIPATEKGTPIGDPVPAAENLTGDFAANELMPEKTLVESDSTGPVADAGSVGQETAEKEAAADTSNPLNVDGDVMAVNPESKEIFAGVTAGKFAQLTKKNQQYIVSLNRHLQEDLHYEVRRAVFAEIVDTLVDGQAHSQTAKQLYGTPTELAQVIRDQKLKAPEEAVGNSSAFLLGMDGSLFLGSLFTFITGVSMMTSKTPEANQSFMGFITLIINYIVAGFAMYWTSKNLPNPDAPKGKKGYTRYFLIAIASMVFWFIVVSLSNLLIPKSINFMLPAMAYLLIGGTTFYLRYYLRRRYQIKGGVF